MMSESASGPVGWNPKRGPFSDTVLAITFVADAGRLMLESSTSVSEVRIASIGFCRWSGSTAARWRERWMPQTTAMAR